MRLTKLYNDRALDLHELWKRLGRTPPGPILVLPAPNGPKRADGGNRANGSDSRSK